LLLHDLGRPIHAALGIFVLPGRQIQADRRLAIADNGGAGAVGAYIRFLRKE